MEELEDPTVSYNLTGQIQSGEIVGNYDPVNSYGRIISQKDLPIFNPQYKENNFFEGEGVFSSLSSGSIAKWNATNSLMKVTTSKNFEVGEIIVGESSKTEVRNFKNIIF